MTGFQRTFVGVAIPAVAIVIAAGVSLSLHSSSQPSVVALNPSSTSPSGQLSSTVPFSGSGFLPGGNSLSGNPPSNGQTGSSNPQNESTNPTQSGAPTNSGGTQSGTNTIGTSSNPSSNSTTTALLTIPTIPDSQITINPEGVATIIDFLEYFNTHYSAVAFSAQNFSGVLRSGNGTGTVLFTDELINKAIADNNFAEIHNSLQVQENFTNAEINYLRSIKVTGDAVATDKETIGFEDLTLDLINNAFAVEAGTMSKGSFLNYYQSFNATAVLANQQLMGTVVLASKHLAPKSSNMFGPTALAQGVTGLPFGGIDILPPIECSCDLAILIEIGPPAPASLFVPDIFLASPFFFPFKSTIPGSYWLGLYLPAPIPCNAGLTSCAPVGAGGAVIMAGTSLIP
jgi:hypothetical protein